MKLQAIHDGQVYATDGRRLLVDDGDWTFSERGVLPAGLDGWADVGTRLKTSHRLKPLVERVTGSFQSVNVWPVDESRLVATVTDRVLVSTDGGASWTGTHRLRSTSAPMGVLPPAFCATPDALYLGEYPTGDDVARVLRSTDGGEHWTTVLTLPAVRHVHAVQHDPYTGDIWITTGDTDDESRIGRLVDGTFQQVGGGSQRWRAVDLAFTPDAVLWGVDSVYEPTNPILRLRREDLEAPDPSPAVLYELASSVYYAETLSVAGERWVAFSTAAESGNDSTAPDDARPYVDGARLVVASGASAYTEWYELAAHQKRSVPADRVGRRVPSASAFILLAACDERGLVANPYNTADDHGTLQRFPPALFAELGPEQQATTVPGAP